MRLSAATSLAILGLVSSTMSPAATAAPVRSSCFAGGCSANAAHVDQVAASIQSQADAIMRFVKLNFYYQGQCMFGGESQHLIDDARAMKRAARHIHEVAHNSRGRPFEVRHIRQDVVELDRLVHHVQELAARMSRQAAAPRGRFGPARVIAAAFGPIRNNGHGGIGLGGHYPAHGNAFALRQLQRKLSVLSNSVHHLMRDVSVPCGF